MILRVKSGYFFKKISISAKRLAKFIHLYIFLSETRKFIPGVYVFALKTPGFLSNMMLVSEEGLFSLKLKFAALG